MAVEKNQDTSDEIVLRKLGYVQVLNRSAQTPVTGDAHRSNSCFYSKSKDAETVDAFALDHGVLSRP
jgi:hypothetical protein